VSADNIMKHGTNNAVILLDVVLSRIPFVSYHFQVSSFGTCLQRHNLGLSCMRLITVSHGRHSPA